MVKFIEVNPEDIENVRETHRGRVSYPIIKGFLETEKFLVEVDTTGVQQKPTLLNLLLRTYVRNHGLPVKVFMRTGKIYLMRLDITQKGEPTGWDPMNGLPSNNASNPVEITADEVAKRYEEEKGQTTK